MNITPLKTSYTNHLRANQSARVSTPKESTRSAVAEDITSINFSDTVVIRGKEVGKGKRIATKVLVGLGAFGGMVGGMVAGFNPVGAFVSAGALGLAALKSDAKLTLNGKTLNFSRPFAMKATDSMALTNAKKAANQVTRLASAGVAAAVGFSASPIVGMVAGAGAGVVASAHGVARFMPN